jgi:hypothetical protein
MQVTGINMCLSGVYYVNLRATCKGCIMRYEGTIKKAARSRAAFCTTIISELPILQG